MTTMTSEQQPPLLTHALQARHDNLAQQIMLATRHGDADSEQVSAMIAEKHRLFSQLTELRMVKGDQSD